MCELCPALMEAAKTTLLEQLEKLLASHDWTYDYSDDYSVWSRGQQEREAIRGLMQRCHEQDVGAEADGLYDRYRRAYG